MKRDLELQRKLLIEIEESTDEFGLQFVSQTLLDAGGYPEGHLEAGRPMSHSDEYNLEKLFEAGYVSRQYFGEFTGFKLTHSGHDFLDSVREAGIWESTKEALSETGGSAAIEVVKAIAIGFAKKKIQTHTGIEI